MHVHYNKSNESYCTHVEIGNSTQSRLSAHCKASLLCSMYTYGTKYIKKTSIITHIQFNESIYLWQRHGIYWLCIFSFGCNVIPLIMKRHQIHYWHQYFVSIFPLNNIVSENKNQHDSQLNCIVILVSFEFL